MKNIHHLFILMLCIVSLQLSAQNDQRILLHSGAMNPTPNLENFISEQNLTANEIFDGYYYRFIQFNTLPNSEQKIKIATTGIKLLDYIPHNTFMAAIPLTMDKNLLKTLNIRCIITQHPIQKTNSNLLGSFPDYAVKEKGTVDVVVQYQQTISEERAQKTAAQFGQLLGGSKTNHTLILRIADNTVNNLAEQPWVFYLDAATPPSTPDDTQGRSLHRSNFINSNYATGLHYDGAGVAIGLADDGEVGPHIDFTGRMIDHVGTGPGGTHGDMTSGIAAGAGNLDPTIRGMGTGAELHVFDINGYPHILNSVSNYTTFGTVIMSTSYSQGCNAYTTDTQFGDQTIHDNPQLEFVFSAGNNGTGATQGDCGYGAGLPWATITGGYKQGKNVIACANLSPLEALDPTSSRGPASDGRIKPDISSNGLDQMSTDQGNTYQVGGGTSAACPGIAGICSQLYQAYKDLNGGNNPESPLIKACLLNSAEDIGNPGPDYTYGWGRVNARRAYTTFHDGRYLLDSVDQGNTNTHSITVPANVRQLRAMLYWLDPAGTPASSPALVNDLNMQITDPSAAVFNPWVLDPTANATNLSANAIRGIDNLNNMEQVTIDSPAAGNFIINVTGTAIPQGPQRYYIVYEFRTDDITVTYPNGGEGFVPGETEVIRWDAQKGVGTFTIQYSIDNGVNWINIATANSNTLQYPWLIPNNIAVTGEALIRVSNSAGIGTTDTTFSIINTPQNIVVDWACTDSIHLIWDPVASATGYEVYLLGTKYMDPIGTSTSTEFFAVGLNASSEYWFSVSAITPNGMRGRRAYAINKQPGIFNCPLAVDAQLNSVSPQGSTQSCQNNSNLPVTILLENFGQNAITNIPVSYSFDGGASVNETYTGNLAPFTSVSYTFTATINISTFGNHTIKSWAAFPGDLNALNDTVSSNIILMSGVSAPVPLLENMESFSLCATTTDCEVTICPLQNGWVNETNGSTDDIDFRTNAGSTPSAGTGPDIDHTTGTATGNYLYLEASGGCNGKIALLTSPCIDLTPLTTPQLSFWYHMYGAAMGELHFDVYDGDNWTLDVMPPITGNQGNSWNQQIVSLNTFSGDVVNLRFRGITGTDFTSDLALDDINIDNTSSVNDQQFAGNVMVYPNPSSGIFTVEMNGLKNEQINMSVFNMEGRLLLKNKMNIAAAYKTTVDMHTYSQGIYFLEIKSTTGVKRFKLTVL